MPAWTVSHFWDRRSISDYQEHIDAKTQSLKNQGVRATCEDLPLRLMIDFAASRGLPFRIRNGSRPWGYRPEEVASVAALRDEVLRTTGAADLLRRGNTVPVGADQPGMYANLALARPGDLIYLQYRDHGHVQLVIRVSDGRITIAQGNLSDVPGAT